MSLKINPRHSLLYSLFAGLLAISSLFFLSCFETKTSPLDPNTVNELQYKGSISGHVRDEGSTKGITGVSVVCAPGGYATSTDTSGHYIIPDVGSGTYSVTFTGDKYNDSTLNGIKIAIDQDLPELDVFLKKFLCKFGGAITDNRTAGKLAGTTITAVSAENVSFSTTADTAGNFVLNLLIGTYTITFMHDGYLPVTVTGIEVKKGQYSYPFSQQMKSAICQISGNVLDKRTLSGIAGVQVSVDSTTISATTNADGYYILNCPNDSARTISVGFTHALYRDTTIKAIAIAKEQAVRALNIMMVEKSGSISGKISDQQTLGGITGVAVTCNITGITTTSDQAGNYTMSDLPPGMYKLTFTNMQYRTATMDSIVIANGEKKTGINIALGKLSSSIAGKVTDSQNNGISGVAVTIGTLGFSTNTNTEGAYVLPNVPQGTYALAFTNAAYRDTSVVNVVLASGQYKTGVDVTMSIIRSSIAGKVTDKTTGGGISGVSVTTNVVGITTTTDQSGNYVIANIPKGSYKLTFTNSQYHDTTLADTLRLAAGENKAGVDMAMNKLQSSIAGRVTDKATGGGISGVSVTTNITGVSTTTDQNGSYILPNVSQGKYRITFTNAQYHDTTLADTVILAPGENKTGVNVAMDKLQSSIAGKVTDREAGMGISGVTVTVSPGGYSSTSDGNGSYTIPNVPQGTYALAFSNSNYKDTALVGVVLAPGQYKTGLDVTMLKLRATISGTVTNLAKGTAESGVAVSITGVTATTNASGAYTLSNVPAGSYTIQFTKSGFADTTTQNVTVTPGQVLTGKNMAIRQNNGRKNISGLLTGNIIVVSRVIATVTGDSIAIAAPLVDTLDWTFATGIFSGQIQIPVVGSSWNVAVRIYDQTGAMVGYRKVPFTTASGAIGVASFNAENAKPTPSAGADTTVSIKDVIRLRGSAVDSFNLAGAIGTVGAKANIAKWEWKIGGGSFVKVTSGDTDIIAPSTPNAVYACSLRVTDSDGNMSVLGVVKNVNVVLDVPVAGITSNSPVFVDNTITLHGTATQTYGSIATWQWKIGNSSWKSSRADTSWTAPSTVQAIVCSLLVIDDDGNRDSSKVVVSVVDVPAVITVQPQPVTVNEGGSASFTIAATGTHLTYQWQKDGTNILGATYSSYTIPTTKVETHYGSYTCTVSNLAGSVLSDLVKLSVIYSGGTVTDADGNVYQTVQIGSQIWITTNLRTTKYTNGSLLTKKISGWDFSNLTTSGYIWYNNDSSGVGATYGPLYNWLTANSGGLLIAGWHVPTGADWLTLSASLGGASIAGGKMKEIGITHWSTPNLGATDDSGFKALPGGYILDGGFFFGQSTIGCWWSSSHLDLYNASNIHLANNSGVFYLTSNMKCCGFSIRLLRD